MAGLVPAIHVSLITREHIGVALSRSLLKYYFLVNILDVLCGPRNNISYGYFF